MMPFRAVSLLADVGLLTTPTPGDRVQFLPLG